MKKILTGLFTGICGIALGALTIVNLPTTNITTTSAWFNANITATNGTGTNPVCTVFYGTIDYTNNANSWASSNVYGQAGVESISTNLTGLSALHKYYYRWRAIEGTSTAWSASTSNFWTKPTAPTSTPAVVTISLQTDTNGLLKAPTNFFNANSNLMKTALGNYYSTGTPLYVESDPVYTNWLATNTYIQTEVDPIWGATSNQVQTDLANLKGATNALNTRAGNLETATNTLNTAVVNLNAATNNLNGRVSGMEGNTGKWETAYTDSSAATNDIVGLKAATNALNIRASNLETSTNTLNVSKANTNELMARDGVIYKFTNAPSADGYVLKFYPTTSNAQFAAESVSGSGFPLTNNVNLAGYSMTNGSFVGNGAGLTNLSGAGVTDHTALTNFNGDTNVQHLTTAEKLLATNYFSMAAGTAMNFRVDGGTTYPDVVLGTVINSAYRGIWGAGISNQVAILNTNTAPLQSYLDTSNIVAIINTNYFPLQSGIAVSNTVAIINTNYFPLQSGISVSNTVAIINTNYFPLQSGIAVSNTAVGASNLAAAALPASWTNTGIMTAAHLTGGNLNAGGGQVTNVNYLQTVGSPGFLVNSADPTVLYTNNTFVKVRFTNEIFDTTGAYNPATNYRFTPGIAGRYLLSTHIMLVNSADSGDCFISIEKNGVRFADNTGSKVTSLYLSLRATVIDEATATDYYEVFVRVPINQTNTIFDSSSLSYFSGARLP